MFKAWLMARQWNEYTLTWFLKNKIKSHSAWEMPKFLS